MASTAYWAWVAAGRKWTLARPIADMQAYAKKHKIVVLGTIGNPDHLTAAVPEDHTPFSATAWPKRLPGYIVTAIDIANSKGLGGAILRDARAGQLGWLKYMNVAGKHYEHGDGFRAGRPNPDQHIHLSCRTDHLDTALDGYDPLGDDMSTAAELLASDVVPNRPWKSDVKTNPKVKWEYAVTKTMDDSHEAVVQLAAVRVEQTAARGRDTVLLAAVKGDADAEQIMAHLDTKLGELRTGLATDLAPVLVTALRDELGEDLADEQLLAVVGAALRDVLGSLDENATP